MCINVNVVVTKTGESALAKAEPGVIVIFGATGDLTKRKFRHPDLYPKRISMSVNKTS